LKKEVNWLAVEADYRAGVLSTHAIAETYGISRALLRRKADQGLWVRNNEHKVRALREEKLAIRALEDAGVQRRTEQAAIEITAENQAGVVSRHRKAAHRYQRVIEQLLGELQLTSEHIGTIVDMGEKAAVNGPFDAIALRRSIDYIAALPTRAKVAKDLVGAFAGLVDVERRSHGIKDDDGEGSYEERLEQLRLSAQQS